MAEARVTGIPVVAVVGRPNVGKSSLVNRVLRRREAIVEEMPGVTRDRRSFTADWAGRNFELIDTGGLELGVEGLDARVAEQAELAIETADVIVLVVDGQAGATQDDHEVAKILRRTDKPVLVAVNKIDDPKDEPMAAEFFRLGVGEVYPLSALHGRGSGDFLSALTAVLPEEGAVVDDAWASVAIVGRPNVGKSSILNALLGEYRSIVDEVPGTTRDPVDSYLQHHSPSGGESRRIKVIDTAGMRKEVRIEDPVEYFSFIRSRRTMSRVDAAVLVVDVNEGVTGHDQRIAQEILEAGRACVIVLNKWDLSPAEDTDRKRLEQDVKDKLRFVPWANVVRTSALTKRGIERILPAVETAVNSHRLRLATSEVNKIIRDAQIRRPHPRTHGKAVRVLYAVQARVGPPTIILFVTGRIEENYLRHLDHRVRETEPFPGSPIRFEIRRRTRRDLDS